MCEQEAKEALHRFIGFQINDTELGMAKEIGAFSIEQTLEEVCNVLCALLEDTLDHRATFARMVS